MVEEARITRTIDTEKFAVDSEKRKKFPEKGKKSLEMEVLLLLLLVSLSPAATNNKTHEKRGKRGCVKGKRCSNFHQKQRRREGELIIYYIYILTLRDRHEPIPPSHATLIIG